jgi:hypothetical protein
MICRNIELIHKDKVSYIDTNELTFFLEKQGFKIEAIAILCLHLIKGKQFTIDGEIIIQLRKDIKLNKEGVHYLPNTEINN